MPKMLRPTLDDVKKFSCAVISHHRLQIPSWLTLKPIAALVMSLRPFSNEGPERLVPIETMAAMMLMMPLVRTVVAMMLTKPRVRHSQ